MRISRAARASTPSPARCRRRLWEEPRSTTTTSGSGRREVTMRRVGRWAPVAALLALGVILSIAASAQQEPEIPDAVVRKMIELGLRNIQRGLCGGLDGCAPATPEEFELPPITPGQARVAILTGTQSAFARWCGLDADRRSVAPMLRLVRQKLKFNERQVALVAVIHGIQQSIVSEQLKTRECDKATRSRLDSQLPKG